MITLLESASPQTFKFIPRIYNATTMVIKCEATNESTTFNITPTQVQYYLSVTDTFDLKQGYTYTLKVYYNTDIVYYDKIFCTNQTLSEYSINNGEYVEHTSNNDFIIL